MQLKNEPYGAAGYTSHAEVLQALKARADAQIGMGLLPLCERAELCGGYGPMADCTLCDLPIESSALRYEVRVCHRGRTLEMKLHIDCFLAWESVSYAQGRMQA